MGESEESYEDFVIKRRLKKTFERLGIGVNPKRLKFKETMDKIFAKHHKALDELDDD